MDNTSQLRNLYVLICKEFAQDSLDNMNSIIKIIDTFNLEIRTADLEKDNKQLGVDILNVPASYVVATSWFLGSNLKKDTEVEISVNIFDAEKTNLDGPTHKIMVNKGSDKLNMNFALNGLPVKVHGTYSVEATLKIGNKEIKADYPFKVLVKANES